MLRLAILFLVIAIIAGVLGFGVTGFVAAEAARICLFIFLVLFVISLIMGYRGGRAPL
jgi:uncharacterized membrane protein YtjA (UPF0391 family)